MEVGTHIMDKFHKALLKRRILKAYFFVRKAITGQGTKFLREKHIFREMEEPGWWQPNKLPNEPQLIKIHKNVNVAADVVFYTHDIINGIFSNMDGIPYQTHGGCIEIFDNVFIGGNSIIIGDVSIGPNAIIAAGSVVTKDVKPGTIVGGNPAKVIGNFEEFHQKRKLVDGNKTAFDIEERKDELWDMFYLKREIQDKES